MKEGDLVAVYNELEGLIMSVYRVIKINGNEVLLEEINLDEASKVLEKKGYFYDFASIVSKFLVKFKVKEGGVL